MVLIGKLKIPCLEAEDLFNGMRAKKTKKMRLELSLFFDFNK
jgi:hypothetical protein